MYYTRYLVYWNNNLCIYAVFTNAKLWQAASIERYATLFAVEILLDEQYEQYVGVSMSKTSLKNKTKKIKT